MEGGLAWILMEKASGCSIRWSTDGLGGEMFICICEEGNDK